MRAKEVLMKAYEDVLEKAKQVRENAYAPYSKFRVGACVKTKDGKYFMGANVENASYSLTNCAERTALLKPILMAIEKKILKPLQYMEAVINLLVLVELVGRL